MLVWVFVACSIHWETIGRVVGWLDCEIESFPFIFGCPSLALVRGCLGGLAEPAGVAGGRGGIAGGGASATGWSDRCIPVAAGSLGEGQRPHVHPLGLARR